MGAHPPCRVAGREAAVLPSAQGIGNSHGDSQTMAEQAKNGNGDATTPPQQQGQIRRNEFPKELLMVLQIKPHPRHLRRHARLTKRLERGTKALAFFTPALRTDHHEQFSIHPCEVPAE